MSDKLLSSLFYGFVLVVMGAPPLQFPPPLQWDADTLGTNKYPDVQKVFIGGG